MQPVSPEYKESMKSTLRDRGYMRIELGNVNASLQDEAVITGNQEAYSNPSKVFKNGIDDFVYATLEHNFSKVDGSMYFFPNYLPDVKEKSFVGDTLISEGNDYQVTISFSGDTVTFDTIIFNFGDNYPVTFTITDSNENTYSYENTTGRIFEINQEFDSVSYIVLTVTEMKSSESRLRIYSINFNYGLEYQNDMIIDSSLESSLSPINKTLPQMNFNVKLVNEDHYFDIENPKSIVNQFGTATVLKVYYGYQLTNNIEWLQAAKLFVERWQSTKDTFTLFARDILQTKDKDYYNGQLGSVSLYDLAVEILEEIGIDDYEIDNDMNDIYTTNPVPLVSCKEALQIVANAAQKILFIRRDGSIKIGSDVNYDLTYTSESAMLIYSNVENIKENDTKYDYASLEKDFTKVDGSMYFYHTNSGEDLHTGYVSSAMSDENGNFSSLNPIKIVITSPKVFYCDGFNIVFGSTYATSFTIKCYWGDTLTMEQSYINNQTNCEISFDSVIIDKIEILFFKTVNPYSRLRINYLGVLLNEGVYDFEPVDVMTYPTFNRFEKIQKIIVPYQTYSVTSDEETLVDDESLTVTDVNQEYEYYWTSPHSGYTCDLESATIVKSSVYSVTIKFTSTGDKEFSIYGKKININKQNVEEVLNTEGTIITWENPLIDSKETAEGLLDWVKDYYTLEGTYEFDTRGNPELDANDKGTQQNYFGEKFNVLITDLSLGFNGAFSGSVKTLKVGGEE